MQANTLDEEAVQLLAFAKDIVTVLGARRMEAEREAEKYFRASLTAAEFVYEAYSAMRIAAQHPVVGEFRKRTEFLRFFSLIPSGACATFLLWFFMRSSPSSGLLNPVAPGPLSPNPS